MIKKVAKVIVSICTHISPKLGSEVIYYIKFRKKLNLNNPKTFNEKLMYIKLNNYNLNESVWKCADKYTMREYCMKLGVNEKNFPKLLGTYNNANEIDFSKLPNKFVLKCSHGMGYNIICENKSKLNYKKTRKKLNKWLNTKFGYDSAETHYNHIPPKIICEEFIEDKKGEYPVDYKIYCFNGFPKVVLVCTDRKIHYKTSFYDVDWNRVYLRNEENQEDISKPKAFEEMLDIAKIVSKNFPFVRVDFYEKNSKAVLGEMTFTPAACLGKYTIEADKILADMIDLRI